MNQKIIFTSKLHVLYVVFLISKAILRREVKVALALIRRISVESFSSLRSEDDDEFVLVSWMDCHVFVSFPSTGVDLTLRLYSTDYSIEWNNDGKIWIATCERDVKPIDITEGPKTTLSFLQLFGVVSPLLGGYFRAQAQLCILGTLHEAGTKETEEDFIMALEEVPYFVWDALYQHYSRYWYNQNRSPIRVMQELKIEIRPHKEGRASGYEIFLGKHDSFISKTNGGLASSKWKELRTTCQEDAPKLQHKIRALYDDLSVYMDIYS